MTVDAAPILASSIAVCRLSGRRYLGCELDAGMAEKARARIAAVLLLGGSVPS